MSLKSRRAIISTPGGPEFIYTACDGQEFFDLDDAVKYDRGLHSKDAPKPMYEQIWTIQQAINMAVAEGRVVRFISSESNVDLKKGIIDKKGCKLFKPSRESNDVAVVPPSVKVFDFEDIDTTVVINLKG